MKYLFFAASMGLALAQNPDIIPECARPCIERATASSSSCEVGDYYCACASLGPIQAAATSCVVTNCGTGIALSDVVPAIQSLCQGIGSGSSTSISGGNDPPKTTIDGGVSTPLPTGTKSSGTVQLRSTGFLGMIGLMIVALYG
ncbi:hypothetical protein TWF569_006274 [Orbilia oligospora]|uniref:CFEM domain-containing protein n=1 Tax=Orbilia oligospora TaxID=2813651 RepID=A0A7C8JMQ9_ORBOL|nr:hypothetical protein TWF706_004645 [Orbilia oligospora]KAF3113471.1 hypothetical protein TWF102_000131 [Orbilia oligospora]KAF3115224.1 hypothetical protein TWF103_011485 [Orbilia oligospora]KAF3129086.1 hypothetical protein TWF703_009116 [Orbilia oligospora]KAF3146811.1 hypothetical protein TWF569_006274 [Orbilia oligospora]